MTKFDLESYCIEIHPQVCMASILYAYTAHADNMNGHVYQSHRFHMLN